MLRFIYSFARIPIGLVLRSLPRNVPQSAVILWYVNHFNNLLAIITWGKKHREYNQYKWQVQPGRNCLSVCDSPRG